jgi:uncharacterized protein (TIGR02186 family)
MKRLAAFLFCFSLLLPQRAEAEALGIHMAPRELSFGEVFTHTSLSVFISAPRPGEMVLIFEGAPVNYAISRKERAGLFWLAGKRLVLHDVPSFYLMASSKPLSEITDKENQALLRLPMGTVLPEMSETEDREFAEAFLRLKEKNRHYDVSKGSIEKLPHNSFRADFHIPSNVPVGNYKVRAWLFQDGKLVATGEQPYVIRKTGMNLALSDLVQRHQILSSLLTIGLMLAVGLMGSFLMPRR